MPADTAPTNFTNHFLIAMPGLSDELFGKSVVFMCEHSERGALGLIINKPSGIDLSDLFEKVDLPLRRTELAGVPVLRGGPLQPERGFVLHDAMGDAERVGADETPPAVARAIQAAMSSSDEDEETADEREKPEGKPSVYASTMKIGGGLEMTTSRDVLEAMSSGAGPRRVLVTLGYSSWGEGQLESEITENSWLTVAADPRIIFDTPVEQRYEKAMALLGVQSWMLAPGSGHA
ncbi:YqgE/AlgH family protein [Hydrogenophaga aquatica]